MCCAPRSLGPLWEGPGPTLITTPPDFLVIIWWFQYRDRISSGIPTLTFHRDNHTRPPPLVRAKSSPGMEFFFTPEQCALHNFTELHAFYAAACSLALNQSPVARRPMWNWRFHWQSRANANVATRMCVCVWLIASTFVSLQRCTDKEYRSCKHFHVLQRKINRNRCEIYVWWIIINKKI